MRMLSMSSNEDTNDLKRKNLKKSRKRMRRRKKDKNQEGFEGFEEGSLSEKESAKKLKKLKRKVNKRIPMTCLDFSIQIPRGNGIAFTEALCLLAKKQEKAELSVFSPGKNDFQTWLLHGGTFDLSILEMTADDQLKLQRKKAAKSEWGTLGFDEILFGKTFSSGGLEHKIVSIVPSESLKDVSEPIITRTQDGKRHTWKANNIKKQKFY